MSEKLPLDPEHAPEWFDLFGEPCKKEPCRDNPRLETANNDPAIKPDNSPGSSFINEMGPVADDLRQLYTDFGAHPYRVFSVVYEWQGGEIGRGDQVVLSETELLPTPEVYIGGTRLEATAGGTKDTGTGKLTKVSPRYTEDDIFALYGRRLAKNQKAFIEVRMDGRDGPATIRRRYTVKGTPTRRATKFDWEVPLSSQEEPRDRDTGQLEGINFYPKDFNPGGTI